MQLEAVEERLAAAGCVAADEEAAELLAHARSEAELEGLLRRREQGEPLAWLVGGLDFCGRRILVDRGVYVPRHQTQQLAMEAAACLGAGLRRAVDLCTGCGAVAAHLAAGVPGATVVGADVDPGAVRNALRNGVPAVRAGLATPLRSRWWGVVTAVAPYVPTAEVAYLPADVRRWEPLLALDGGRDGLGLVRQVVDEAARLLVTGGWFVLELGGDQDARLAPGLAGRFDAVRTVRDEDGDLRGLITRRHR